MGDAGRRLTGALERRDLVVGLRRLGAGTLLLLCPIAHGLEGQAIELRLLDDSTRTLVPGAIVRLLDAAKPVQALSDGRGRVLLLAPAPGSYRVRVARIGFIGLETGAIAMARGDTVRHTIVLPSIRLDLPTIEVEERTPCESSLRGGSRAAALWEEIRKALTANLIVQQRGAVPLRIVLFERPVAAERAGSERVLDQRIVSGQPFQSLEPRLLATRGFVQRGSDSVHFAGPDAALLMSEEFVSTHCYRVAQGPAGRVGLAFDPIPNRRVPDIRGTLWVDRRSGELRHLEFSYTGLPGVLRDARAGGRVDFRRLDDGSWIVDQWFIRTPTVEARVVAAPGGLTGLHEAVVGYVERGGRVEAVGAQLGAAGGTGPATLSGTVFDSLAGAYLAGVAVRVAGLPDSAVTDSSGWFRLTVPAEGPQVVSLRHRRLGLLPDSSRQTVVLVPGRETVVESSVPPLTAFISAWCPGELGPAGLLGLAQGSADRPAEGLTVQISWVVGAGPRAAGVASSIAAVEPRGEYAACRLPANEELTVHVHDGHQVFREDRVTLRPGEYRWLELLPTSR